MKNRPPPQRNKRKRFRPRRHSPGDADKKFLRGYEHLIAIHNEARKRYFEQYHKGDDRRRRKLELKFFRALEQLREFEQKLTPQEQAILEAVKCPSYRSDTTYSGNHQLAGSEELCREWMDSMLSPEQLNRPNFHHDQEVSSGTMENYLAYRREKS